MSDILSGVGRVFTPPIASPHCRGEQLRRIGLFQPPSRCLDGTSRYNSYDQVPMQHTDLVMFVEPSQKVFPPNYEWQKDAVVMNCSKGGR